jgi:hypothetical protein
MLSQWFWIMVSYAEPNVVNHDEVLLTNVFCCASGWESWCGKLSQWL